MCVIYVCVRVCDICSKLLQIVVPRSSRVDTFCDNRQSECDIGVCAHSNDYHSNDKCVCNYHSNDYHSNDTHALVEYHSIDHWNGKHTHTQLLRMVMVITHTL